MKLIVGLGNPGTEYAKTRHNLGWISLDRVGEKAAATWTHKPKFTADVAEFNTNGEKVLLAKPTTYYNLSGQAIRKIKDFYHIEDSDILVVHDEMALPVGSLRTRQGGSDAGNNGIKSLVEHIGPDFARLRIGSGALPIENGNAIPATDHRDHVLGRPDTREATLLKQLYPKIEQVIMNFASGQFDETTVRANSNQ